MLKSRAGTLKVLAAASIAALAVSACATKSDIQEAMTPINSRLDQIDQRVQSAAQSAESANQAATQAATDARTANQRIDQINSRIDTMEQQAATRTPRG